MNIRHLLALIVLGCSVCVSVASADVVKLENGDRLTGTVTSLVGGKLVIHTADAGDVTVDVKKISTFSTTAPLKIKLSDGSTITGVVRPVENGLVLLDTHPMPSWISLGEIQSINGPPPVVWTGDIKFGGLLVRGNTDSDSVNFGFDFARTSAKNTLSFHGAYVYGRTRDRLSGIDAVTADNWGVEAKDTYNFTPRKYGFLDVPVSHDRLALLYLRVDPSLGMGYKFFDKPEFMLAGEAGVGGICEQYSNGTPPRDTFSLKLAYHLTKKINDKVSLFSDLSYFPSVINVSQFIVDVDDGVHVTLNKHLFGELRFDLDYDNTPANGALHTDSQVALNLGYNL